jgi:hypothetical protein
MALSTCAICLEDLDERSQALTSPCNHRQFHFDCLDTWISEQETPSCPLCREEPVAVIFDLRSEHSMKMLDLKTGHILADRALEDFLDMREREKDSASYHDERCYCYRYEASTANADSDQDVGSYNECFDNGQDELYLDERFAEDLEYEFTIPRLRPELPDCFGLETPDGTYWVEQY